MRKTILTILLLAAIFSIMGCCNSQTHAEEIDEIQIIEPVDTLANIPMTIKFTSVYIPCTVNGKTQLFLLDPEWKHNCIEKRFISELYDTTGTLRTSFKDGYSTVLSIHTLQYTIGNQNLMLDTTQVISHCKHPPFVIGIKPFGQIRKPDNRTTPINVGAVMAQ